MAKRMFRTVLTVIGGLVGAFILFALLVWLARGGGPLLGGERIARVDVIGPIFDADETIKQLKRYAHDDRVKAIVVRIDSPGGEVAPSQELYRQIRTIRREGKPVVASMGSVAASGGYYVALAAEKIYANPGTLTGSIGVIAQFPNVQELVAKIGVKVTVIKSGKHKDLGNPLRELSPEERELIQGVIDDVYQQFLDAVVESRDIDRDAVSGFADGRIFSAASRPSSSASTAQVARWPPPRSSTDRFEPYAARASPWSHPWAASPRAGGTTWPWRPRRFTPTRARLPAPSV